MTHFITAIAVLLLVAGVSTTAQEADTLRQPGWPILHIGRINADCYPDTLYGSRSAGRTGGTSYLPRLVAWGQAPELPKDDKPKRDSLTECMGPFAATKKKLRATAFSYPAWEDLGGTVAVGKFNRNDTLPDLMITIWGRYRDDRGLHDTTYMMCLFSQHALDTIRVIDVGSVGEERREKFAARRMRKNGGLVRPGTRDLSGRLSWELDPMTFLVEGEKNEEGREKKEDAPGLPLLNEIPDAGRRMLDSGVSAVGHHRIDTTTDN